MIDDLNRPPAQDLAQRRRLNTLHLFDAFVASTVQSPDAITLRGLEKRFAERLGVQPSYWSQIKSGGRQIGERLARQFERAWRKPPGWLDQVHAEAVARADAPATVAPAAAPGDGGLDASTPRDDDERFIVALVLSYARRHPALARTRLLELLGEALQPQPAPEAAAPGAAPSRPGRAASRISAAAPGRTMPAPGGSPPAADDDAAAWREAQSGVRPLGGGPRKG